MGRARRDLAQRVLLQLAQRRRLFLTSAPLNLTEPINARSFVTPRVPWSVSTDMVRAGALQLAAREIAAREVKGVVAELGVYRGDFARLLSLAFPDRELYLFDTFSGFDPRDVVADSNAGDSKWLHDFTRTTPDMIRRKLHHPERAHIYGGWFPESASGITGQRFCFVSLDTDLYEPTLAGLTWFHERLAPGGYIFVHDFANDHYGGVRRAVRSAALPYTVLPDSGGTAVITR